MNTKPFEHQAGCEDILHQPPLKNAKKKETNLNLEKLKVTLIEEPSLYARHTEKNSDSYTFQKEQSLVAMSERVIDVNKNCSTVLYTTQNNTLIDITTSFEEKDKLIQEIIATKLQDMVKTVVVSSSSNALKSISHRNQEETTDKLIREVVGTKIEDMVKTVIARSTGDSLENFLSPKYPYKYKQLEKKNLGH